MRKLFALLCLVSLVCVACESDEAKTPVQTLTPEITITPSGIVTMPAAGGNVELSYSIINPVEGVELEATADSDWITDLAVDDKITFSVERNHSDSQRIGIVTLSYAGAENLAIAIQQNEALASGDVRLSITSERKTIFEATGGTGKVTYMLECDEEGAMPEVSSDVEWITIDSVDESTVNYTVLRSNVEERRSGHIILAYSGKSVEAVIEQKAAELIPILSRAEVRWRRPIYRRVVCLQWCPMGWPCHLHSPDCILHLGLEESEELREENYSPI